VRLLVIALLAAGCTPDWDPQSFVDGLRVLAVKAEPPEIAPGQSAQVTAVAWETAGAPITYEWASCLLASTPTSRATVNADCLGEPPELTHLPGGADGPTTMVTMPDVMPSALGIPDATLGLYLPLRLTVRAPGSAPVVTFYLMRYALGTPPNHNPKLLAVEVVAASADGGAPAMLDEQTPLPVARDDRLTLRARFSDDSKESFLVLDPAHPEQPMSTTEQLRVSWYATAGHFSQQATGDALPNTEWRLETHVPAAGTPIELWAVGIDERGGTDVLHRQLIVR
jgi:hypothetical protein